MRRRNSLVNWLAVGMVILASFLLITQLVRYASVRATFPTGLKIAGVPVGGLTYETASDRLTQVYLAPIEIKYQESRIQVRPATLGFTLKLENMLAAADKQRTGESFWVGFWKYLWNQPVTTADIPLQAQTDDTRIESYLRTEVASRYDQDSVPPMPIPGESGFYPGVRGTTIDYPISTQRIEEAMMSINQRSATLEILRLQAARPSLDLLDYMLKGIIDASPFDGLVEIYLRDLKSGQTLLFTHSKIGDEEVPPGIAYSAWSTIKIPVLAAAFEYLEEPYEAATLAEIEKMVELSDNDSTDAIARDVIERNLGPIRVTDLLQAVGLENTFWGGYFQLGSPLLRAYKTPANERTDYFTNPDPYAQTTPQDMGMLMEEIYYCAENGGGALPLASEGRITQHECELMVEYLSKNKIGVLIQAGVPSGTIVAHKHGWAYEYRDGYIHTIGDAALVFTPETDYALSIFVYHPVQAVFNTVNRLFADLSSGVYNYYNYR